MIANVTAVLHFVIMIIIDVTWRREDFDFKIA